MEKELNENDFIFSKTDKEGKITYCNNKFEEISEHTRKILIGAPHNILRHKDMPKIAFKILWDKVKSGEDFFGFVKNKTKNNNFYWVFAYVSVDKDIKGNIVGYSSIRRKINKNVLSIIEPLYKELINLEKISLSKSEDYLNQVLLKYGMTYNELIVNLQEGKI